MVGLIFNSNETPDNTITFYKGNGHIKIALNYVDAKTKQHVNYSVHLNEASVATLVTFLVNNNNFPEVNEIVDVETT
jgi:hypothetical protein